MIDAKFILKTTTDITDIEVVHQIEKALDECLRTFGLSRISTTKGEDIQIDYERVAWRP